MRWIVRMVSTTSKNTIRSTLGMSRPSSPMDVATRVLRVPLRKASRTSRCCCWVWPLVPLAWPAPAAPLPPPPPRVVSPWPMNSATLIRLSVWLGLEFAGFLLSSPTFAFLNMSVRDF